MNLALPKVSLVMACYNCEGTLRESLNSILEQTMSDFEAILIDDGSRDRTPEILRDYASKDERLRLIIRENRGLTTSLIEGCQLARAPYVARQDGDDYSSPDRLMLQSEYLDGNPQIGFVSCFANYVGPKGEFLNVVDRPLNPEEATHRLLNERLGPPAHGTVMFRRTLYEEVGGYREPFYFAQDADLWLRMAEKAKIGYVNKPCYVLRVHAESISGTNRPIQKQYGVLAHECRSARLKGESEATSLEKAVSIRNQIIQTRQQKTKEATTVPEADSQNQFLFLIASSLVRNRDRRAIPYLSQLLRRKPFHLRAWFRFVQILAVTFVGLGKKHENL